MQGDSRHPSVVHLQNRVFTAAKLRHNSIMTEQPQRPSLIRWLMTPPQAYLAYFVAVVLIGGVSFYVGSLKPNRHPGLVPATSSAPTTK